MSTLNIRLSDISVLKWLEENEEGQVIEASGNVTLLMNRQGELFAKMRSESAIHQINNQYGQAVTSNFYDSQVVGVERKNSQNAIAFLDENKNAAWIFELNEFWDMTMETKDVWIDNSDPLFYSYEEIFGQQFITSNTRSNVPIDKGATIQELGYSSWANNEGDNYKVWSINNYGQSEGYRADADTDAMEVYSRYNSPWGPVHSDGHSKLTVAVIDTGINYNHLELRDRWIGNNFDPIDGIDNDQNGYTDDRYGWNFVSDSPYAWDDQGHGTHVSGTIGASANSSGISGINPIANILPLKTLNQNGSGYTTDTVEAINYAVGRGAKVINMSLGSDSWSNAMYSALWNANANGVIVVAAAGNDRRNIDYLPSYPAAYNLPNIVSVASIDPDGTGSDFTNYGKYNVDLAAPGGKIWSTGHYNDNNYQMKNGTSMAAPAVSGAISYYWAKNPYLSHHQVISNLLASVEPKGWGEYMKSGGTLNLDRLFRDVGSYSQTEEVQDTNESDIIVPEWGNSYKDVQADIKYATVIDESNMDSLVGSSVEGDLIINFNLNQGKASVVKDKIKDYLNSNSFGIVEGLEQLSAFPEIPFGILDIRNNASSEEKLSLMRTLLGSNFVDSIELDSYYGIPETI